MFSKPISLAVTFIGVGAIGWAVAFSSDDSTATTNTDAGSGSSGTSGSATGTSGTATGTSGTATGTSGSTTGSTTDSGLDTGTSGTATGDAGAMTLIDDMSSTGGAQIKLSPSAVGAPAGSVAGYWYVYNDGSGSQTPAPMTSFTYTTIGAATGDAGASAISIPSGATDAGVTVMRAACTKGVDNQLYGYAAEGFNFATEAPADAGGGDATAPNPAPVTVDLSAYSGVSFWLYTDAGETIAVQFPDDKTDTTHGACLTADGGPCGNSWQAAAASTAGVWTYISIPFSALAQNAFFTPSYMDTAWDSKHVYSMAFQVSGPSTALDAGGTPVNFTYCVANINLTK